MALLNLVGMRFRPPADKIVPLLKTGDKVILVREPENTHDPNAIAVYLHLGYIKAEQASELGPEIDKARQQMAKPSTKGYGATDFKNVYLQGIRDSSTGRIEGRLIQTPSGWPCIDIEEDHNGPR